MKSALVVLMLTLASMLIACGGSDTNGDATPTATAAPSAAEIPVIDITKTDQTFEAPDSVPGGLTRIRFHNAGTRPANVDLSRSNDGATLEQVNDAISLAATDFAAAAEQLGKLWNIEGGTAAVAPGGKAEVVLDLEPGRYGMSSLMVGNPFTRALEVTAAPAVEPAAPEAAFTVIMSDFVFEGAPDTLPAASTTVQVVNDGPQLHMMSVWRLKVESVSAEQLAQHRAGTPLPATEYTPAGGFGEILTGDSGWVTLDLQPGDYAFACIVFDQSENGTLTLHTDLGMQHAFTVQ
jgi:hypothetical protein